MNAYKNQVKLKKFIHLNKLKVQKPKKNILSNVNINKALNQKKGKWSNLKVKYPSYSKNVNNFNNESWNITAINNVFSHRPLFWGNSSLGLIR